MVDGVDVALIRWPGERQRLDLVRELGQPRLLVVEDGLPPAGDDPLEDWMRAPVDIDELRVRVDTLRSRAERGDPTPAVDEDGLLRFRGQMVTLAPVARRIVNTLIARWGSVVTREALMLDAWAGAAPRHRNVLDVHITRLRPVLESIGLELKTVRRRGYLLRERAHPPGAG